MSAMSDDRILSLIGLCLRGGRLAVGEEPVEAAARARDARVLLLAADASDNTRRRVQHFADAGQCLWIRVPYPKDVLGRAVGRTSVAVAAVTDTGLAAALAQRLADADPDTYAESARRLELKARRAAERRQEQLAHEKNVRRGKSKPASPPPQPEEPRKQPRKSSQGPRPPRTDRAARKKASPYAHSRPVKKGKGSFRKKRTGPADA